MGQLTIRQLYVQSIKNRNVWIFQTFQGVRGRSKTVGGSKRGSKTLGALNPFLDFRLRKNFV